MPAPAKRPPEIAEPEMARLRLIRSRRVGPVTYHRLMAEHGSAEAALAELPAIARAAGLTDYVPCTAAQARDEIATGQRLGARLLLHGAAGYPPALADLTDAPPALWLIGDPAPLSRPMIALVGARNASSLGLRMARNLAADLAAAGVTVVSGLARGIDAAAHEAALPAATVAVQAGGIEVLYPAENADLARRIAEASCRLTEQPPGLMPQARHFPARNRIISGLARAVVVVEAAARSGSLITARTALDQGREVMVVPGHPFDGRAGGCNLLIRDGALLIRSAADVLAALDPIAPSRPPLPPPTPTRPAPEIAALHARILDRLGPSPTAEDQLIRDLALPAGRIAPILLALELDGAIERQPGGLIARRS